MTVIATASNPRFSVSRVDIDRPGPTYTIDTLRDLAGLFPDAELFFITGADALAQILTWRDVDEMFKLAQFVGCTRPGTESLELPLDQLPIDRVTLLEVPALAISSTECRRAGRQRQPDLVPGAGRDRPVHRQARPLHQPLVSKEHMPATERVVELLTAAAEAAHDKKAENVLAFDVSEQLAITDAFLVASASNDRQVRAIVDAIEEKLPSRLRRQAGTPRGRARRPLGAARLPRGGHPRPARRGAQLLLPRAALARLPADPDPRAPTARSPSPRRSRSAPARKTFRSSAPTRMSCALGSDEAVVADDAADDEATLRAAVRSRRRHLDARPTPGRRPSAPAE